MKKLVLVAAAFSLLMTGCLSMGSPGTAIPISNASFELPQIDGNGGDHLVSDDWIAGGTWFGRFKWEGGVADGKWAAWASAHNGGPDNGFSQQLESVFEAGTYQLEISMSGDNTGLSSRLILGYTDASGGHVELAHNDDVAGNSNNWRRQLLKVVVPADSPAIGQPIWIRVTAIAVLHPNGGDSNWWDRAGLTYWPPAPAPAPKGY